MAAKCKLTAAVRLRERAGHLYKWGNLESRPRPARDKEGKIRRRRDTKRQNKIPGRRRTIRGFSYIHAEIKCIRGLPSFLQRPRKRQEVGKGERWKKSFG